MLTSSVSDARDNVKATPTPLDVRPENIPAELRTAPQWVNWRFELRPDDKGKLAWTKAPYNARTGARASVTNAADRVTFDEAMATYHAGGYSGIGFVLTADDDFVGLDFDHVRDPQTGEIDAWVLAYITALGSHAESSPSATGVRIIVRGELPDGAEGRRFNPVELYASKRYLTITGHRIPGAPITVNARQDELNAVYSQIAQDHTVLSRLLKKPAMAALFDGDSSAYGGDLSAADLALCGYFAFATQGDAEQMDRLFRRSKRLRDKWDELRGDKTYGELTIAKALESWTAKASTNQNSAQGIAGFRLTPGGNALRFIDRHGSKVRYCADTDQWYLWDSRRWASAPLSAVEALVKETISNLYTVAADLADNDRRTLVAFALSCENSRHVADVIKMARSEAAITIRLDQLDRPTHLLNVLNGTIDLRNGELHDHDPDDLLTKQAPVEYAPDATSDLWTAYLAYAVGGDEGMEAKDAGDLADYLQTTVGYTLTGETSEERAFVAQGPAASCKSTFIDAVRSILGPDYSATFNVSDLEQRQGTGWAEAFAQMHGVRFVYAVEAAGGRHLDEGLFKKLTGGDMIRVRGLYKASYEYRPAFKMWFATNEPPSVSEDDDGVWRRMNLLPFHHARPEDRRDPRVKARVQHDPDVHKAILAWAMRGAAAWYRSRPLRVPQIVVKATNSYRAEMDTVAAFVADMCVVQAGDHTENGDMWDAYTRWCWRGKTRGIGRKGFTQRLAEIGAEHGVELKNSGGRKWFGIRLRLFT